MFLEIFFLLICILILYYQYKLQNISKLAENIPGPKTVPLLGNALEFGLKTEEFFMNVLRIASQYKYLVRIWLGPKLIIALIEPSFVEAILNSSVHIDKAYMYKFIEPWMGTGLLTSTGHKWKSHRKFLTPTFHFKILEQFVYVFNYNGKILVQKLSEFVNGPTIDISSYIQLYALDVISESAMGISVNAQCDSNSDYVQAVKKMENVIMQRSFKPWIHPDFLFQLTSLKKIQKWCLGILHGMTNSVIKNRKQDLIQSKIPNNKASNPENDVGEKRRQAFLDLLLSAQGNNFTLTDEEIREEVDTIMFEGHDTTTSGICFTLWILAKHQDIQEKVAMEIQSIFHNSDHNSTFNDLQEMKYLELVIKEVLRLYPSVPVFGRVLKENVKIGDYILPAESNVIFLPYTTHRNPDIFPNPEKFDPDRFLPENCIRRHPFSYIPFAAGPRNCIGQKFAMLEMKSIVSEVLRHYKIKLADPQEELELILELVLKPANGVKIKLEPRIWTES